MLRLYFVFQRMSFDFTTLRIVNYSIPSPKKADKRWASVVELCQPRQTQTYKKPTMDILALLQPIEDSLSKANLRQMSRVVLAVLAMTGRVTMLGLSRWAEDGGSYRTIQRFYNTAYPGRRCSGSSLANTCYGRKRYTSWQVMKV